jgi:tetratricopeptide (TPR) repeat protein
VDSEMGKIHYPLAWSRAGIQTTIAELPTARRDIMVARPTRGRTREAEERGATAQTMMQQQDRNGNVGRADSVASSDKWGSETVNFSTGNKERDDILARARAILQAHAPESLTSPENGVDDLYGEKEIPLVHKNTLLEEDLVDDGVASLGGNWGSKRARGEAPKSLREMLQDPMNYLKEIHEEASKQLKENNIVDAQRLFEVVLQCQRHRHGPLHPDVAAALHNIGITQLRAQNHSEALKAFEEAARVRKGSLGKDHPLVAVRSCLSSRR